MNLPQAVAQLSARLDGIGAEAVAELVRQTVDRTFNDASAQELLAAAAHKKVEGLIGQELEGLRAKLKEHKAELQVADQEARRIGDTLDTHSEQVGTWEATIDALRQEVQELRHQLDQKKADENDIRLLKLRVKALMSTDAARTEDSKRAAHQSAVCVNLVQEQVKSEVRRKQLISDILWPFGKV